MSNPNPIKDHQFLPGNNANPKGRPKGSKSLSSLFRKALKFKMDATDPRTKLNRQMTLAEIIVLATVQQAAKGNVRAMNMILDRLEGKPVQPISGPNGEALQGPPPQIIFQAVDPAPQEKDG